MGKRLAILSRYCKINNVWDDKKLDDYVQREINVAKESLKKQIAKYHLEEYDEKMQKAILLQLKKRRRSRRLVMAVCTILAIGSLGYFTGYYYLAEKAEGQFEQLAELKKKAPVSAHIRVNKTGDQEVPDILDEYKNLYNKNKSIIGWLKIDDTIIDYPVMQSADSEYYLDHNFEQEYDKNGSIFMDPACDVLKPSTNLILYGHHMKSGKMFGSLKEYASEAYMKAHSRIHFDTIYEKAEYQVMYVFRDSLKQDTEITFKYYQFIDVGSPEEFTSNMLAMEEMSLYDTGVTASYGDQLLTLSTCDNSETDGRFVVVAKRVG